MFRFVKTLFQRSAAEYVRDDCGQLAAAISYYTLFSLFPLLIFVVAIAGVLIQDSGVQQDIVDEVLKNIPLNEGEGRDSVTNAVRDVAGNSSGALSVLGLAGMAWAGSSLFGALRKALNTAFDDRESKRPFFQQKAIDLALVLALAVFFLDSIGATAFLRVVRTNSTRLGALGDVADSAGPLWDLASYAIPLVFSVIAFARPARLGDPSRPLRPGAQARRSHTRRPTFAGSRACPDYDTRRTANVTFSPSTICSSTYAASGARPSAISSASVSSRT